MSEWAPAAETRDFMESVTVTCPHSTLVDRGEEAVFVACGRTARMAPRQRNDPRHPGIFCDGVYGARHPVTQMLGPEGKSYR